ncbi:HPr family phosphocarrier protein [Caldisalinibacter kiritimatiensis]|uniref:Phosphocarrier protein HPr n=1 Tax=Caldisalinibacter kiritimatiensis TaxID=1304284 RepID=R1CW47_9FIRM|nr:HPr family phosphocarrier protein [Caldisalinibacter kiritimatiensis]EOD00859.1 Catabolite repression HPr-like protein Crh [Caldisalinibacter kiritimatiensis]
MESRKVIIKNKIGLHARPAALFVQTAGKFLSDIIVEKGEKKVNAKSIMGIMALGVSQGEEITIIAKGEDEKEAIEALVKLLNKDVEGE